MNDKQKLAVSFSGGRTSAFMARWLQLNVSDRYELLYVFGNTGSEHEGTLEFIQECDDAWNMGIHWVEAVVHHGERKGCTAKEVDFNSAARTSQPFQAVIEKYGLPNAAYLHCSRELKLNPINDFIKSYGWTDHLTAVGIRADEVDRISPNKNIIYPLISMLPTRLDDVLAWWSQQPFNLQVDEHFGNCQFCFKKSYRKLATVMSESPEVFEFPRRMEAEHGLSGHNIDGNKRVFFRGNKNTEYIAQLVVSGDYEPFVPSRSVQNDLFWDAAGGCSESCDIYAD